MAAGAGRILKAAQKQKDTRLTAGLWMYVAALAMAAIIVIASSSSSSAEGAGAGAEGPEPANDRRRLAAKFPQFNFIILPSVR